MKAVIGLFKQKWMIQLIGIIALCAVIWFASPLISISNKTPFESKFNRLLAILAIVIFWAVYNLIKQVRANQKDQQLMTELAASQVDPSQAAIEEAQSEEISTLRRKFEEALQLLKKTRSKSKRDRQYLYELPWYVIIGAPGAGKTTLLLNSGLTFPLSEHFGENPVQGVGGTRNCDWLFSDSAVFLDTAGRYTTQDSHHAVDETAWKGFLDLIKTYRPRQPINGVLVTMSMSDLLQKTEQECSQHAREVRQRIQELYGVLGVRFPVYMLFTKCDLVAGFTDFFGQMGQEEREQVWGETFPGDDSNQIDHRIDGFDGVFEGLLHRLNQRTFKRIQEDPDIRRRSLILDYPQQMALLGPALKRFLQDTFRSSRFEASPLLRGVYFTSATQEGTPIDRVMGLLAGTYGLDRQSMPIFSGKGKSFFITRLLKEVIIPEAELAGVDPRVERRQRALHWAAIASILALTAGVFAVWTVSFIRNKYAIASVEEQIIQYEKLPGKVTDWDMGAKSLLSRLNILQHTLNIYEDPSLWMRFGLYQGDKIQSAADRVYEQSLRNSLIPLVKTRLEQRIYEQMSGNEASDLQVLFDLLKVYLMLGDPDKMDTRLAGAFIEGVWKQRFSRSPTMQDELRVHSDNLLELPHDPLPLNLKLIAAARRILNAQHISIQIYAHLRSKAREELSCDFQLQDVLVPHGDRIFTTADGQDIRSVTIPGLYTYQGYHTFFKKQGVEFVKQALEQNWVLDNPAADQESDLPRLFDDLQKRYFDDYQGKWRHLLDNLRVKKFQSIHQTIQILDYLAGDETPLWPLLEAVEANTTLTRVEGKDASGAASENTGKSALATSLSNLASPSSDAPNYPQALERRFEDINYLVRGSGKSPRPILGIIGTLNELRDFLMQISSAAKSEEQALELVKERMRETGADDAIRKAKKISANLPEPLSDWVSSCASFGWEQTLRNAKSELNAIWKTEVLDTYEKGLKGRYPLFQDSRSDAAMNVFGRFFSPNGIIDQFFQTHLKTLVDTTRSHWRQVAMDNQAMGLSNEVLKQFQDAARIRDAFFAAGGTTPSVQFELKPVYLDDSIATFRLNIEGEITEYSHGPMHTEKFQWPGPNPSAGVSMIFKTIDGGEVSRSEDGPWALLRMLDNAVVAPMRSSDRFIVKFQANSFKARYEFRVRSVHNPFRLTELKNFRCPESL